MRANSDEIIIHLKYLRRYARALTGSQDSGDRYVRICLEAILADAGLLPAGLDVRVELFRLFHSIARRTITESTEELRDLSIESRLQALPPPEREVLLLTSVEGFSSAEAARILDITEIEAERLRNAAWVAVGQQIATDVLIIEDEPVIALDVAALVEDLGHRVVGTAASQNEAVAIAERKRPGLILADIDLGAGGSGMVAVAEILAKFTVPVIFVTAFPERLLTGERPEPTFLVTKPFDVDTLKVTISQALSFSPPAEIRKAV